LFGPESFAVLPGASPTDGNVIFKDLDRLILTFTCAGDELIGCNLIDLHVRNLNSTDLLVGLRITHREPDDDDPIGAESFSGGRELLPGGETTILRFPDTAFGGHGSPRTWDYFRKLEISFGFEKNYTGPRDISVAISGLYAGRTRAPVGPRLTDEGLRHVLRAGSDPFRSSTVLTESALTAFVPSNQAISIPPPHPYPKESAGDITEGLIMSQRVPFPIPWDLDPYESHEWSHFLHRHHFLREVVRAASQNKHSDYVTFGERVIEDWIIKHPVPVDSNGGAGPSWETLTAAWRLREWLWAAGCFWSHEAFREPVKLLMLRSVWEHCRHLTDHKGHPNNWIIVESAALTLAGMCFPEFSESDEWIGEGLARLDAAMAEQFFDDGVHFEISPLYHAICLLALLDVIAAASTIEQELPEHWAPSVERSLEFLASLCRPDFTWPSVNDAGSAASDYTLLMLKAAEVFQRDDFRWIGSKGRYGAPPAPRSRCFMQSGIVCMRSGFDTDAHLLVFRAGPAGASHYHNDALSLDVTAFGRSVLADPGITTYSPDKLTEYYRSAPAHTMVTVDGSGPTRSKEDFVQRTIAPANTPVWESNDLAEIATGAVQIHLPKTSESCVSVRTVVFVGREYWLIRDVVIGDGHHEIGVGWQFAPGRVETDIRRMALRMVNALGAGLDVLPISYPAAPLLEIATGGTEPPRGWVSLYGRDMPATHAVYVCSASLPCSLVTLLVPNRTFHNRIPETELSQSDDGRTIVTVGFPDGHSDTVTLFLPDVGTDPGTYPTSEDTVTIMRERPGTYARCASMGGGLFRPGVWDLLNQ
jgi:hypothetical protein